MKPPDLGTIQQLLGVPELIQEVLQTFRDAPAIVATPAFMLEMVKASLEVAMADGDEGRREAIQVATIRLQRQFA